MLYLYYIAKPILNLSRPNEFGPPKVMSYFCSICRQSDASMVSGIRITILFTQGCLISINAVLTEHLVVIINNWVESAQCGLMFCQRTLMPGWDLNPKPWLGYKCGLNQVKLPSFPGFVKIPWTMSLQGYKIGSSSESSISKLFLADNSSVSNQSGLCDIPAFSSFTLVRAHFNIPRASRSWTSASEQ